MPNVATHRHEASRRYTVQIWLLWMHWYSSSICEKYVDNIAKIEKDLVDLRLKADGMSGKEKKQLKEEIKHCEESVEAMKVARKNLARFISSFGEGMKEMQK